MSQFRLIPQTYFGYYKKMSMGKYLLFNGHRLSVQTISSTSFVGGFRGLINGVVAAIGKRKKGACNDRLIGVNEMREDQSPGPRLSTCHVIYTLRSTVSK